MSRAVALRAERGFTYLWVLVAIAVLSIGLLAVSEVWVTSARRQQLDELDWIGSQFKNAIGQYYEATPGVIIKTYPPSLQDLLLDKRYITVRRYLREVYRNPLTGSTDWTTVTAPDNGVRGVRVEVQTDAGVVVREYVFERVMVQ